MNFETRLNQQLAFFRRGQLYRYLSMEKVMLCPADSKVDALFYQRNLYYTSYVWNGAINGYRDADAGNAFKLTKFKPLNVLQWETDETTPFYFNDSSSFPDEGISRRHGEGATIALFGGSTERISVKDYYGNTFAGTRGSRGAAIPRNMLPNRSWCNPRNPTTGLP